MAKKQKGSKHEKVRKTVPATVQTPAKAAKRTRQAKPRLAKPSSVGSSSKAAESLPVPIEQSESAQQDTLNVFEVQLIDLRKGEPEAEIRRPHAVEVEAVALKSHRGAAFFELDLSMPQRWEAVQTSDCDLDLGYKNAAEQVALAMLEAEQAAAFCQGVRRLPLFS